MPISFTCPKCGSLNQVEKRHRGDTRPCLICGRKVDVPWFSSKAAEEFSKGYSEVRQKSPRDDAIGWIAFLGVVVLASLAFFWWFRAPHESEQQASPGNPQESQVHAASAINRFKDQLGNWQQEKERLSGALRQLEDDKSGLIERLRMEGVRSSADLNENPKGRLYAEELLEVEKQIAALQGKDTAYETAIAKVESTVRRLERRLLLREVGVSEEELNELSQTVLELDEEMRSMSDEGPGIDLEIENVVNQALGIQ